MHVFDVGVQESISNTQCWQGQRAFREEVIDIDRGHAGRQWLQVFRQLMLQGLRRRVNLVRIHHLRPDQITMERSRGDQRIRDVIWIEAGESGQDNTLPSMFDFGIGILVSRGQLDLLCQSEILTEQMILMRIVRVARAAESALVIHNVGRSDYPAAPILLDVKRLWCRRDRGPTLEMFPAQSAPVSLSGH